MTVTKTIQIKSELQQNQFVYCKMFVGHLWLHSFVFFRRKYNLSVP